MLPQSKLLRGIRPARGEGQELASQEHIYRIRTFISGEPLIFFFFSGHSPFAILEIREYHEVIVEEGLCEARVMGRWLVSRSGSTCTTQSLDSDLLCAGPGRRKSVEKE